MIDRKVLIDWAIRRLASNSLAGEEVLSGLESAGLQKIKDQPAGDGNCRNVTFEDRQSGRHLIICLRTMKSWRDTYKNRPMPTGGPKEDTGWAFHGQETMFTLAFFLGVTKVVRVPSNMTSVAFHNRLVEDMRKEL